MANDKRSGRREWKNPADGKCFNCGEPGHISRECPAKENAGVGASCGGRRGGRGAHATLPVLLHLKTTMTTTLLTKRARVLGTNRQMRCFSLLWMNPWPWRRRMEEILQGGGQASQGQVKKGVTVTMPGTASVPHPGLPFEQNWVRPRSPGNGMDHTLSGKKADARTEGPAILNKG
ncbi:hypothetical protein BRADI_3g11560v3 [Brachypodium distachyon]|uniref:CCHC-type domain-containing protein n=1 Tax=Brachypodium distachyon TaxID=15368 RepID=I1HZZ0_BRADI|nr:hypothetical protein BRADI_3g11560v3 [Brachypodium distachyon]